MFETGLVQFFCWGKFNEPFLKWEKLPSYEIIIYKHPATHFQSVSGLAGIIDFPK